MIFFKKKIIFIHIPRCGGTTIEKNLWQSEFNQDFDFNQSDEKHLLQGFIDKYRNKFQYDGLQHLIFKNIKKIYPQEVQNFFKFSFVRNPFSRIASMYAGIMTFRKDLRDFLVIHKDTSFENFLHLIKQNPHTHWLPMSKFFDDKDVNFIGRFENFDDDLKKLKTLTDIDFKGKNFSGELNFSEKFNYLEFYSKKKNVDLVSDIYEDDLDRFNYNFEDFQFYEKQKKSSIPLSPNLDIPKKEKTLRRYLKKFIKKKIYLYKNKINF